MKTFIAALLTDMLAIAEQPRIEALRWLSDDAYPTINVFSNECGLGIDALLPGVARADGRYETVGVADPDRVSRDLSSVCAVEGFYRRLDPSVWSEVVRARWSSPAAPGDTPINLPKLGLPKALLLESAQKQHLSEDLVPAVGVGLFEMTVPDKQGSTRHRDCRTPACERAKQAPKREEDNE
ncbi:MAG: hypothetical protein RBU37_04810 [Myxococcota bacterium]|jgi:hypothetical protein|nr:hypothetical protein [Myxococcota bacterium]